MTESSPSRLALVAGLATVYLVWGSTYLAIRIAIETMPPFLMAAARFLLAGLLLYGWARWRGAPKATAKQWSWAVLVGGLMLMGGNGLVSWAEQRVASGLAALLVATVPLWMVLMDTLRPGGGGPGRKVWWGLLLGLAGIVLLVGPGELAGGGGVDLLGAAVLMAASLFWAVGSLVSRTAHLPDSPLLGSALQMLSGGAVLIVAGTLTGEWSRLDPGAISGRSLAALVYLALFGSILAFSAYLWLLRVTRPAVVGTYAFVNPVVAVLLGWVFAAEPLNARIAIAATVIVAGVVLITAVGRRTTDGQAQTAVAGRIDGSCQRVA